MFVKIEVTNVIHESPGVLAFFVMLFLEDLKVSGAVMPAVRKYDNDREQKPFSSEAP